MTTLIPKFDLKNGGSTPASAVNRSIFEKLSEWVSVDDFGADPTGIADSTAAIQAALTAADYVIFPNGGVYLINSTLTLKTNQAIDFTGAFLTANTGSTPLFQTTVSAENIKIQGGEVTGTCSWFLKTIGTTDTPASEADYVSRLWINDVFINSDTVGGFVWMNKAARKFFISNVLIYSSSGILSDGKAVEVFINNSFFYSPTAATNSYGIQLSSTGGGAYYNEGWQISNCSFFNFDICIRLFDIFAFVASNLWLEAGGATKLSLSVEYPTTTTGVKDVIITDFISATPMFLGSNTDMGIKISNGIFTGVPSVAIDVGLDAAGISISDIKFDGGTISTGVGVRLRGGNALTSIDNIQCGNPYNTYVNAVQVIGTTSVIISCRNITHFGSSAAVYAESPVLYNGVMLSNASDFTAAPSCAPARYNTADLAGSYATGVAVSSLVVSTAQGETGWIVVNISTTGMDASTQRLTVNVPTGVVVPSGSGWSAATIVPNTTGGIISLRIPYYCTAPQVNGTLSLTNTAGNTITVSGNGYFGIVRW
jgi:hypothetical protein